MIDVLSWAAGEHIGDDARLIGYLLNLFICVEGSNDDEF
jgi:hypothetical protein